MKALIERHNHNQQEETVTLTTAQGEEERLWQPETNNITQQLFSAFSPETVPSTSSFQPSSLCPVARSAPAATAAPTHFLSDSESG